MTSCQNKVKCGHKTVVSRNNMLRYTVCCPSINKLRHQNSFLLENYEKINTKLCIIKIIFAKLPRNNTTYECRRQKWYIIYVYLPIQFSLTVNNTSNLGECLTRD